MLRRPPLSRARGARGGVGRRLSPSVLRAACASVALLCVAFYLRDWAFEGLVRVGSNGRLGELRFAPPSAVLQSCPTVRARAARTHAVH